MAGAFDNVAGWHRAGAMFPRTPHLCPSAVPPFIPSRHEEGNRGARSRRESFVGGTCQVGVRHSPQDRGAVAVNGWIYAAVLISIAGAMVAVTAAVAIGSRVLMTTSGRRPVLSWLLVCLALMALAQGMEQIRVLLFRLSFDGLIDRDVFESLYDATWNVVSSKVIAAVAMTTAAALKIAIWLRWPDHMVVRLATATAGATLVVWVFLSLLLERVAG